MKSSNQVFIVNGDKYDIMLSDEEFIMKKKLNVNGFEFDAYYSELFINQQIMPLIETWQQLAKQKKNRVVVFLAAPPGAGKSTLSLFIESCCEDIQALSLDGFHYPQSYLDTHTIEINHQEVLMKKVKGRAETFDTEAFKKCLESINGDACWWPIYDRNLHDVVVHQIHVVKPIVLIEGNWLLLDEKPWNEFIKYADFTMFIYANSEILKQRLIARKMKGGLTYEEALHFYESSDVFNCARVLKNRLIADFEIDESIMNQG